jgi:hypothetical protein
MSVVIVSTVMLALGLFAREPAALASFAYTSAHDGPLAKSDDWRDPSSTAERTVIHPAAELDRGRAVPIAVHIAVHTWGERIRARATVRLRAEAKKLASLRLVGEASLPGLRLSSAAGSARADGDDLVSFDLVGDSPLPRAIAALDGEVRWKLIGGGGGGGARDLGRTHHRVLVTAGPARRAESWPVSGRGTDPPQPDHNAFTAYRLEQAVRIARGATSAASAAELAWRVAKSRYDLAADADVNPWSLLADGAVGQCMTAAAFIEAVVNVLGFPGGRIVYVYPTLSRPRSPGLVAIPNPRLPGAFTVEAADYDVRGQFRSVDGAALGEPGHHAPAESQRHHGAHGIERLKFRDGFGELHNYATAFVVDEAGVRSYFGGGYSVAPYHSADAFLAAACIDVVWTYEEGGDGAWEATCDRPGPAYVWSTGARIRP